MKPSTWIRVVRDTYATGGTRQMYWRGGALASELRRLLRDDNKLFRRHVWRDGLRYAFGTVRPIAGDAGGRARAAVAWLLEAQRATADDGVSLGYFPCDADAAPWKPSYPETTGYIITSLLAYAEHYGDARARDAALRMTGWEIAVQMPSGAVQGGPVCPPEQQAPAAFNTGMVLDGWCSAYAATKDPATLDAARRAADFLVADLDADGYFRTNGAFVSAGELKTYTCLCAWAIYRCALFTGNADYTAAAVRCIEAALRQQRPNGWFAHNCLARSEAPLTHTLGYTLQGVFEVGVLAGRQDFVAAAQRALDAVLARMAPDGYLAGMFYDDWEPAQLSSCLTGSAQIAIVAYRMYEHTGNAGYRGAADRLVDYLKPLQALDSPLAAVNGALPGSFPLFGQYMRGGYPNWATKYLLDALMLQDRLAGAPTPRTQR